MRHDLYNTRDKDAPSSIKDGNGEVVLDLCKRCNKGEADLEPSCPFVEIYVSTPPWAETPRSWRLLVKKGALAGSWSTGFWFPKKDCKLDEEGGTLTLPRWLYKEKRLDQIATLKQEKTD